jgi:hypothetical protein
VSSEVNSWACEYSTCSSFPYRPDKKEISKECRTRIQLNHNSFVKQEDRARAERTTYQDEHRRRELKLLDLPSCNSERFDTIEDDRIPPYGSLLST